MQIRESYTRVFLQAAGIELDSNTVKEYEKQWWWNLRSDTQSGLRLTQQGIDFIRESAEIKVYPVPFPKKFKVTPQTLVWLDRNIKSPYFIDKQQITVMHERAAFELYLFSGDVKKYGRNRALAERFAQEDSD